MYNTWAYRCTKYERYRILSCDRDIDGPYRHSLLRASVCKYRKPGASCEIFNFFIFCLNKPFSELFSKIQLKVPKAL